MMRIATLATLTALWGCKDPAMVDEDGDGYTVTDDCDDLNPYIHPGSHQIEIPGDGVDPDCDGYDYCRDLNCDGWSDIAMAYLAESAGQTMTNSLVFWGSESGFVTDSDGALNTHGATDVAVIDLDADGYLDITFTNSNQDNDGTVDSVIYWGSNLGFSATDITWLESTWASALDIADIDGDGLLDIVIANYRRGEDSSDQADYHINSTIYWGDEARFESGETTSLPTVGATGVKVADFNGDEQLDIAFSQGSIFAVTSIVYWGAAAGFSEDSVTELPSDMARAVDTADIDGDGYDDMVLANSCGGLECDSTVYWGSGSGLSADDASALPTSGAEDVTIADLNRDGALDVTFANALSAGFDTHMDAYIYWQSSGDLSTGHRSKLACVGCSGVTAGDVDGNGWPDLLFVSQGESAGVAGDAILYYNQLASFGSSQTLASGYLGGAAFTPDVTGE